MPAAGWQLAKSIDCLRVIARKPPLVTVDIFNPVFAPLFLWEVGALCTCRADSLALPTLRNSLTGQCVEPGPGINEMTEEVWNRRIAAPCLEIFLSGIQEPQQVLR